jgi:hypothetical protein
MILKKWCLNMRSRFDLKNMILWQALSFVILKACWLKAKCWKRLCAEECVSILFVVNISVFCYSDPSMAHETYQKTFLPWTDLPMEYNAVRLGNLDEVDLKNLVNLS